MTQPFLPGAHWEDTEEPWEHLRLALALGEQQSWHQIHRMSLLTGSKPRSARGRATETTWSTDGCPAAQPPPQSPARAPSRTERPTGRACGQTRSTEARSSLGGAREVVTAAIRGSEEAGGKRAEEDLACSPEGFPFVKVKRKGRTSKGNWQRAAHTAEGKPSCPCPTLRCTGRGRRGMQAQGSGGAPVPAEGPWSLARGRRRHPPGGGSRTVAARRREAQHGWRERRQTFLLFPSRSL